MAHVQRNKPECPICRRPFGQGLHLVVNYELRDLMQLATALTTVERDEGWETVTSTRLLYKVGFLRKSFGQALDNLSLCSGPMLLLFSVPYKLPQWLSVRTCTARTSYVEGKQPNNYYEMDCGEPEKQPEY